MSTQLPAALPDLVRINLSEVELITTLLRNLPVVLIELVSEESSVIVAEGNCSPDVRPASRFFGRRVNVLPMKLERMNSTKEVQPRVQA
jgi:hypothetical protein